MLGAICIIELSEMFLSNRKPERIEESMTSDASKDALSSGLLTRVGKDVIKTMLNVCNSLGQKGVLLTP